MRYLALLLLLVPKLVLAACTSNDAYSTAVCADTPAAYWRLNESSVSSAAADSSGNSRDGKYNTGSGTNNLSVGATGALLSDTAATAASFNSGTGSKDARVQLCGVVGTPSCTGANYLSIKTSGTWSVEFWGKFTTVPCSNSAVPEVYLSRGDSNTTDLNWRGYGGCSGSTNYIALDMCQTGTFCTAYEQVNTFSLGDLPSTGTVYFYAAFTMNTTGPHFKPYLNATLGNEVTTSTGTAGDTNSEGDMGAMNSNGGGIWPWKGSIDEVAIYTSVLTASSITAHYNAALTVVHETFPWAVQYFKPKYYAIPRIIQIVGDEPGFLTGNPRLRSLRPMHFGNHFPLEEYRH